MYCKSGLITVNFSNMSVAL